MHANSRLLFDKHVKARIAPGMRVLEIGPDGFPSSYRQLVSAEPLQWDTIDIYPEPHLTFVAADENAFPIAGGSYDVVLSGQVIEHVRKIWVWMRELARVCKPGGEVITINPVSWPYHEAPIDCWRMYPEGMRALYEDAGLEVLSTACESIEFPFVTRRVPGRSLDARGPLVRAAAALLGPIGVPIQCAFDTVTIGRKPRSPASNL